jgi:hypothetical protein
MDEYVRMFAMIPGELLVKSLDCTAGASSLPQKATR